MWLETLFSENLSVNSILLLLLYFKLNESPKAFAENLV